MVKYSEYMGLGSEKLIQEMKICKQQQRSEGRGTNSRLLPVSNNLTSTPSTSPLWFQKILKSNFVHGIFVDDLAFPEVENMRKSFWMLKEGENGKNFDKKVNSLTGTQLVLGTSSA